MPTNLRRPRPNIKPPIYAHNTSTLINYSPYGFSPNNLNQFTSPITSDTLPSPPNPPPRHKKSTLKRSRTFHVVDTLRRERERERELELELEHDRGRDHPALHQRRHTTRRFLSRAPDAFVRQSPPHASFDKGRTINNRWEVQRKLGSGAFAQVYEAVDVKTGDLVAVKVERVGGKMLLERESEIYDKIHDSDDDVGRFIPHKYYFKREGLHNVLVMDCLGPSLGQQLRRKTMRRFSTQAVLQMAIQGVRCLQALHRTGVVHRDVKPDNMVVGLEGDRRLYLIDFGLATRYKDWKGRHVPRSKRQGAVGTVDYASVNSMQGLKISRRDDLMSLGYSMVYLYRGSLPWSRVKGRTMSELQERVCEKKKRIKLSRLCGSMPREFVDYFRDVRELGYDERPNYNLLIRRFRDAMKRRRYDEEDVSEWTSSASGDRTR